MVRAIVWLVGLLLLAGLGGCGGSGGGGGGRAPFIVATVIGFPPGQVPPGAVPSGRNSAAFVVVLDDESGEPIADASVSVDGVALSYAAADGGYGAELDVTPGDRVELQVQWRGATYRASARQATEYPTITQPATGVVWPPESPHEVQWSAGTPPAGASYVYGLGVLAADGRVIWPADGSFEVLPAASRSFTLPGYSLPQGEHLLVVGLIAETDIAGAAAESMLLVGGFTYRPVSVSSTPPPATLNSLAVAPTQSVLVPGQTLQLAATGQYSDGSQRDLASQVTWTSSDPGRATVSASGLVSAAAGATGTVTVTATLQGFSAASTLTFFQPGSSPLPPLSQSVTYQGDYAHSGRAVQATAPVFPAARAWSVALSGPASYPVIAGGRAFVLAGAPPSGSGYGTTLHALNLADGRTAWGPVALSGTYFWAGHAYDQGRLYVLNYDGLLRSFDAATGAAGWSVQLPGQYAFSSPPTAVDGMVYVGGAGSGGTLYAVDAASGALLWTAPVANGDHSSPTVSPDGVFVAYPCQVYKFARLSGRLLWQRNTGCSGGGGRTAAYANGRLYVRSVTGGSNEILDAATGAPIGSFGGTAIPAFTDTLGFFLSGSTLQGVHSGTGAVAWSFAGDGQLVSPPFVLNDRVFVASASGQVFALDAATGAQVWSGQAAAGASATDEHNVSQPYAGLGIGEGWLIVPAGQTVNAWRLTAP